MPAKQRTSAIDTAADLLSLDEVCELGKITKSGFRTLRQTGQTPPVVRIGRRAYCRRSDVEAWLAGRMREVAL